MIDGDMRAAAMPAISKKDTRADMTFHGARGADASRRASQSRRISRLSLEGRKRAAGLKVSIRSRHDDARRMPLFRAGLMAEHAIEQR